MIIQKKITIIRIRRPDKKDINKELQWLGHSLGLFNMRDKDKSCYRIFLELLKATKREEPLSSDDLADKLDLTRGTVIHHLNKLMNSGIVINHRNRYSLRVDKLSILIDELKKDLERSWMELKDAAREIDKMLG